MSQEDINILGAAFILLILLISATFYIFGSL